MRRERNRATMRLWFVAASLICPGVVKADDAPQVLAIVDGHEITEADISEKVAPQMLRINNQIYTTKKQAVDAIVNDQLVAQEAKKRGISREELTQQEVTAKTAETSDAEVEEWYTANKARVGDKQLAEVKPQIAQMLKNNKLMQHQQEFLQGLRKAASVKMLLKPPLVTVAIDGAPARGPADAPVTIVEFSDFQCPYCSRAASTLAEVREAYKEKVKIVYKDFPLTNIHPNAQKAAEASHCAGEQDKYWEYHDLLFANNTTLAPDNLKKFAADLKLDADKFNTCLDSGKQAERIGKDLADGAKAGVGGTPAFVINGRFISGALPFAAFQEVIEEELATQ